MRPRRPNLSIVFSLLIVSSLSFGQTGKVEVLGPNADSTVSDAIKKVLDNKGYKVILDDGTVACELWLRQTVPSQGTKEVSGALYPQFAESTFLGVVVFSQPTTDYRGEPIKPGTYTLRYGLLPNDGAHLGVVPNRDFLLLIPASADSDPDAAYKTPELMALSRKATGVQHPGPLILVTAESSAPAVSKDQEEHWVFSAGVKLKTGETLPIALIVKGVAAQ